MGEMPGYTPEKEKTVELHPVTKEALTAYDEEFFIPHVEDGQDVLVGRGLSDGDFYLRCDFSAFAEKLKGITPEKLEELFTAAGKLEQQAPDLDENTRRLLNTCWRVARISRTHICHWLPFGYIIPVANIAYSRMLGEMPVPF